MSLEDRMRNQIDYILVQQRFRGSIQCSEAMPDTDCNSDHNPILCCMKITLDLKNQNQASSIS